MMRQFLSLVSLAKGFDAQAQEKKILQVVERRKIFPKSAFISSREMITCDLDFGADSFLYWSGRRPSSTKKEDDRAATEIYQMKLMVETAHFAQTETCNVPCW